MRRRILTNAILSFLCAILARPVLGECVASGDEIRDFSARSVLELFIESNEASGWSRGIRDAPVVNVFNVSGTVQYSTNVVKADVVTFNEGSILEFMDVDVPFWAIVAQRLVFRGGDATIARNLSYIVGPQADGPDGPDGQSYNDRSSGTGRDGGDGGEGRPGLKGITKNLPCLLIITNTVEFVDAEPGLVFLRLDGINGGRGGNGGKGGDGGNGQAGANASQRLLECAREAKDGGDGGDGGVGGRAGDGGDAGSGGDVVFVGRRADGVAFMSMQILNEPGSPGEPGASGREGERGRGGDDGSRVSRPLCTGSADDGEDGMPGARGGPGTRGNDGRRGREQIVAVADLSPFFEFVGLTSVGR